MTNALKNNVLNYLANERRSVRELERQAGVNYNTINNILTDRSKSPCIDTVVKIADAMGCSIDKMIGRTQYIENNQIPNLQLDKELLDNIYAFISNFLSKCDVNNFTVNDIVFTVTEIYNYSFINNAKKIDTKFAAWLLEHKLYN